jgi:sec-independent protein translocase protein TatA
MPELVVILLIVILIFGASKLPQLGEGLGKAIKGFKKGIAGDDVASGDKPGSKPEGKS